MFPSPATLAPPLVFVTEPHAAGVNANVTFESVNPVGNVSSTRIVVAPGFDDGFVNTKVSVVEPPADSVDVPNDFVSVGAAYTLIIAVAAVPFGPLDVTVPVLFVAPPALAPNTCTV